MLCDTLDAAFTLPMPLAAASYTYQLYRLCCAMLIFRHVCCRRLLRRYAMISVFDVKIFVYVAARYFTLRYACRLHMLVTFFFRLAAYASERLFAGHATLDGRCHAAMPP